MCWFNLEIPWSVYQKERGFVDDDMGRERRGGCLGQSCEDSDLWNPLFSKKKKKKKNPTLEQSMKERDLEVTSESTGCFLLGESKQWLKISGKFSNSEFSCNNFHTLCRKFKIMIFLKQLLEDTESDQIQGEAIGNLTLHSGDHVAITCMWFPPRARAHPADPGMLLKQKFTGT